MMMTMLLLTVMLWRGRLMCNKDDADDGDIWLWCLNHDYDDNDWRC